MANEEIKDFPFNNDGNTDEGNNNGNNEAGKTFTQADVDRIVGDRLARARKDMPSSEELEKFRKWQAQSQTNEDKLKDMQERNKVATSELEKANAKIEQYEREKYLSSKGVSPEDMDYYAFKIGQMVSEDKTFQMAADEFIKDKIRKAKVDMGGSLGGNAKKMTTNEQMNALLRGKI